MLACMAHGRRADSRVEAVLSRTLGRIVGFGRRREGIARPLREGVLPVNGSHRDMAEDLMASLGVVVVGMKGQGRR